jgi:large subunit ribosomal protein L17
MLANMAASLILHKRVTTTTAKAKELRTYVEPLITRSKEDTTHSRRVVFRYLKNKFAVTELFREVSPKIADRPGGYTRILKTGNRLGDNADMCIIELVDYNENYLEETDKKAKSTRRRRGGAKKSSTTAEAKAVKGEVAAEEIADSPAETEEVTAEETGESTSATEEEAEEEETKKEE